MNCSIGTVVGLIVGTIVAIIGAIVIAALWQSAWPLLVCAGLMIGVAFGLIPAIKNALTAYQTCRGPSDECSINPTINALGQAASFISFIGFLVAAALQMTALAFLSNWITYLVGAAISDIVGGIVTGAIASCSAALALIGTVLGMALTYKSCMDRQSG